MREVSGASLKLMRDLCDEHGIQLMFDEVQTGVGRTGKLFAHQWHDVEPDIMAIAKGIGGGFPVGACLAREEVAVAMVAGTHGSTFGGIRLPWRWAMQFWMWFVKRVLWRAYSSVRCCFVSIWQSCSIRFLIFWKTSAGQDC